MLFFGLVMIESLVALDKTCFAAINIGLANPVLDVVMPFLTRLSHWMPVLVGVAVYLLWKGKRKERIAFAAAILAVALTDPICAQIIKPLVGRFRPCDPRAGLDSVRALMGIKTSFSFPSNHAANSMAIAVGLGVYLRNWRLPLGIIAVTIAFSRIYVGVHFPLDTLAGAIIGAAIALGVVFAFQKFGKTRVEFDGRKSRIADLH